MSKKEDDLFYNLLSKLLINLKWMFFGILTGVLVGTVSAYFGKAISIVTRFRMANPYIIFALPFAGVCIVYYYHLLGARSPRGTNLVLDAIHKEQKVPLRMAPLIIVSTVITHLFGGSVGREGAALQVGGSLGNAIGQLVRFNEKDRRNTILCGMSASFSALFGTPLAASIMVIEMSTVGIMYYSALVPCVISALTAHFVAEMINPGAEAVMTVSEITPFSVKTGGFTIIFAILCALVAVLFCVVLHETKSIAKNYIKNPYLRALAAGVLVVIMTLLVDSQTYNGAGSDIIAKCINDPSYRIVPYAFLLKIIFTAVTLSGGFQGGEIVPSLFIGTTFGHALAGVCGMSPALGSALGAILVFCGVTNCPIASILIGFELFGFDMSSYLLLGVAITYLFSGNYSLYASQKIKFNKYDQSITDTKTH
ncbi:chloride channel protein [Oribacterium sp. WCC10]|uniref:chloride channel protein n=1 Tax=Oribacterium sp. WCC10 TaxID=1855343 RepID=UPI0008EF7667|nr:chloride channel protein [Oribacterium sp. WCC10]SFG42615.1 H+/Cl-antiporter ClcA [Oribacterium sp. WCC10]